MDDNIIWVELNCPGVMEGRYMISEYGDIYSNATHKILKPFYDRDGYKRIELTSEPNKYKKFYVHRLVGFMFVEGWSEDNNQLNHLNSIRDDNHYSNLEWTSISGNAIHGYKHGFRKNNNAVYDEAFIRKICENIAKGYSNKEVLYIMVGDDDIIINSKVYTLISRLRNKSNWVEIANEYF